MSRTLDRLAQLAVVAGTLDVIVSGIVPLVVARREAQAHLSENAARLATALAGVTGITRAIAFILPVLAIALVAVGVGLLRQRPAARRLAAIWGAVAIVYLVVLVTANVMLVWPRIDAAQAGAISAGAAGSALLGYSAVKYAAVRMALLRLPFPVYLLWRMRREAAAAE